MGALPSGVDGDFSIKSFEETYGAKLANGLVTWILSIDGQKIVHEAGLVPTEVPVRFARRSPLLGSH